ncbi:Nicotinamide-nucleotide_adenylyltransferase [Hexamita inflata]|uniref:Nicotinamide-nucleotide adenylyltransferase n=1 Tax=Hexamita inflata TaxID=28002 RepID=A0AA86PN11_9EUKA|nr:Nicotinamide-nucleotide adenylyltransferase [Hexamita inflata]
MKAVVMLCGSFNPVTKAHITMAEKSIKYLKNNQVDVEKAIFIPTNDKYPYKKLQPGIHRSQLIQIACKHSEFAELLELETQDLDHNDFRPTAESIKILKTKYSNNQLYYAMGIDQLAFMCDVSKWSQENIMQMFENCSFIVFQRTQGLGAIEDSKVIDIVRNTPHMKLYLDSQILFTNEDIGAASSTAVRNGDLEHIWEDVQNYIKAYNLY